MINLQYVDFYLFSEKSTGSAKSAMQTKGENK